MDYRKLAWTFAGMLVLMVVGTAATIINSGTLPTANATVEITKSEEAALKEWFGVANVDEGFTVGELVCDSIVCSAAIYKEGLIDDEVKINQTKCVDEECTSTIEKTTKELTTDRDTAIEARLKGIAEAAAGRIARQLTAKVGEGQVTVTAK